MRPSLATGVLAALLLVAALVPAQGALPPPNFVVIFADDLGYGDLGCYGHPSIRTPRLDRMAAEGLRFTDFYSAAEVCTPSRAALLTGRYPIRSGMCGDRSRVLRRTSTGGLPADEITLAEALKARGYATACIGKWHLGVYSIDPAHHPSRHGFDFYFGLPHSNDMDAAPGAPRGAAARLDQDPAWWQSPLYRGEERIECPVDQATLTRRYTEEAIRFIRAHKEQPFFVYLPHSLPHVPLFAGKAFQGHSARGLYGDVVEEIDASTGAILDVLRQEGLAANTLVLFTSDNGPWLTQRLAGGSAGLLRDGKGSTFEGGMRVPGIAWWPGRVPPGRVTSAIASTLDVFPTFVRLAGGELPVDRTLDGVDLRALLQGESDQGRDEMIFYRGRQLYAIRRGPWKAHFVTRPAYGPGETKTHDPPLLFQLTHDPGERCNLAADHPDVVAEVRAAVERHRRGVAPVPSRLD